ncbi:MAG: hypothetical protein F6K40_32965 [Okeania sp. SIO3I5]|uniref:hypothetical protein n=1 Tax=Okeania sp. SIO3I5 TaxID=2607805 RepID=UPI0013BE68BF|nr:hypothetical protein [Okeania sp. SIO3I5]NEQ40775.1 hypothetical protein [Okeania sp. SIO3I5]
MAIDNLPMPLVKVGKSLQIQKFSAEALIEGFKGNKIIFVDSFYNDTRRVKEILSEKENPHKSFQFSIVLELEKLPKIEDIDMEDYGMGARSGIG